jgi:hypothetical protein
MSDDMDLLLPPDFDRDKLRWATVTTPSPLTIRLDGETGPLLGIPGTLAWPLATNDRVLVVLIINDTPRFKARRAIIVGKAGGVPNLETRLAAAEAKIAAMEAAWLSTHTPTLTNLTVGAGGVVTFRHRLIGKTLDWKFKFKYGTGSAVGSDPKFTLPYTPHSSYVNGEDVLGTGMLYDTGVLNRASVARLDSGATLLLVAFGNTGNHASIAAGAPWTWGTGDTITATGQTEIA